MVFQFAGRVIDKYVDDDCPIMAAGLAFYAVFSIPALLFVLVNGAGILFGASLAEEGFMNQAAHLLGPDAAAQFTAMLQSAGTRQSGEGAAVLISLAALLFAATGAFVQLQAALNRVWGVRPDADRPFVIAYLAKRLASVGMMAFLGIFVLVSLGLSTALTAASEMLRGSVLEETLRGLDLLFSTAVFTVLFAAMFRWIPDAKIHWRDVWVGAFVTAALFMAAKYGAALYLGRGEPGEQFPAAGSLTVFMLWVYFAASALLLGAVFTHVWVTRRGGVMEPDQGAVPVTVVHGKAKEREGRFTRLDL